MMDDVVGLSGRKSHVESVEHDAGLQIGREGPSDDPARPGVEDDREVEKAGQRRQEGDQRRRRSAGKCFPPIKADESRRMCAANSNAGGLKEAPRVALARAGETEGGKV
jgi:hypothetical protein